MIVIYHKSKSFTQAGPDFLFQLAFFLSEIIAVTTAATAGSSLFVILFDIEIKEF